MNHYEILGIDNGASTAEIERAFRRLARRVHPDLSAGDAAQAEERMKQLNEIRDTLTDPPLRAAYDERLRLEALSRGEAAAEPAGGDEPEPDGRAPPRAGAHQHPVRVALPLVESQAPPRTTSRTSSPVPRRGHWGRLILAALGLGLVASAVIVSMYHDVTSPSAVAPPASAPAATAPATSPLPKHSTSTMRRHRCGRCMVRAGTSLSASARRSTRSCGRSAPPTASRRAPSPATRPSTTAGCVSRSKTAASPEATRPFADVTPARPLRAAGHGRTGERHGDHVIGRARIDVVGRQRR